MDRKTKPPDLYSQREELSVNLKNGKMMSKVLLYLLMITCMLTRVSSTEVKWNVRDTSPKLGQDLTLFCKVDNCTVNETRRWHGGPDNKPLMSNSGNSADKTKYNTSIEKNGLILTILNLTVKDLNVSYQCSCGFGIDNHILYIDVYTVDNLNKSTNGTNYVGKINSGWGVIIGYIAIPVILIILLIIVIKRHWLWRKLSRNSDDNLHSQEHDKRVTVDGQSVTAPLVQTTPVDSNPRQSSGNLNISEQMKKSQYALLLDEIENTNICIHVTMNKCPAKTCKNHHLKTGFPYLWQIEMDGKWCSFSTAENEKIEEGFTDLFDIVSTQMLYNQRLYSCDVEFTNPMNAVLRYVDERLPEVHVCNHVRRLSTPSFTEKKMSTDCYLTQWRWYFKDDTQKWDSYSKDVVQFMIEKNYITKQENYCFKRDNSIFNYRIDFLKMTQTNTDTLKVRYVLRRPLFVSRVDIEQKKYPENIPFPAE